MRKVQTLSSSGRVWKGGGQGTRRAVPGRRFSSWAVAVRGETGGAGRDRAAISDAHGARRGMIWIVKRSGISVRPKSRQAPFEKRH